jgi:hypothetical protein
MVQVQQRGREFKKERSANFFFASFARRLIIKFCVKFVTICCKIGKLSHVATYKRSCRKKEQEAGGCTAWFRCSSEAAKFPDKFKVAFRKFFLCFAREAKFVANFLFSGHEPIYFIENKEKTLRASYDRGTQIFDYMD